MKQSVKFLLLVLILCLSGCQTLGNGGWLHRSGQTASPGQSVRASAVASGVGDEPGYEETGDDHVYAHPVVNPLAAPQDQVFYFAFDDTHVDKLAMAALDAQTNYLIKHRRAQVRLEGHADERGSREYNVALGWRRARAVAQKMTQLGVSPKQLVLVSYGQEKPAALGHDESAWQKNRRVRLVYLNQG